MVFGRKNDDKTSYTKGNGVILAEHTENRSSYSSKAGEKNLEKLRIYTKEGVYKISFAYLTHGKDDFMAEVLKMVEKYEIIN